MTATYSPAQSSSLGAEVLDRPFAPPSAAAGTAARAHLSHRALLWRNAFGFTKDLCLGTLRKARWMMAAFISPRLASARAQSPGSHAGFLGVLQLIETRSTNETAHRAEHRVSQMLRYAVVA